MASSGPRNPTTTASDTSVGTVAWGTPANAVSSNDTRTTAALNNTTSEYLKVTNFGFTIPTNAVITGVMVEVEKSRTAGTGTLADSSVRLVRKGTIIGINHSSQGTAWTGTDAYSTYGGDGDLWGVPWVAAEINAFDFGVVFSAVETASLAATAGVDHVRVTVYYTEGYVSAPQVQDRNEVLLFGHYYPLASGGIQTALATQFPPKVVTNADYGRSSNPVISTYAINDLRGGLGLWRYSRYSQDGNIHPDEANRFWVSQTTGIETRYRGAITLPPLVTELSNPGSWTTTALDDFLGVVMVDFDARTYSISSDAWSALLDTLPAGPDDTIQFNSRLFYALVGAGYSYRSATTGAATDVATPTFVKWVVWDNKIYGMDANAVLYSSTTGDSGTWTTLVGLPSPYSAANEARKFKLLTYYDAAGDLVIYCVTDRGLWVYDAVNNKWFQSEFSYSTLETSTWALPNARAIVFRGSLYVMAGRQTIYRYTMKSGYAEVEDISPWRYEGVLPAYGGTAVTFAADIDNLYVTIQSNSAAESSFVLAWNDVGWHLLWQATNPNNISSSRVTLLSSRNVGARLYFGHNVASADRNTMAMDIALAYDHPLFSTTRTYAASGAVELPYYDGGVPEQPKTAVQARIKLTGASSTETVQVAYRIDGSTGAYTNLGSAIAIDDEVTLPFGTNNVGLAFKSIQFRLTLARGGTTTNAPKIEYFAMDFIRNPEVLRSYSFAVDLSEQYKNRTPQQMVDHIMSHMKADIFGTFAWRDDADNTRSSLVKMVRFEGVEHTGYDQTGIYKVHLVEVGYN